MKKIKYEDDYDEDDSDNSYTRWICEGPTDPVAIGLSCKFEHLSRLRLSRARVGQVDREANAAAQKVESPRK
jgi:hypothetical protein